MTEMKMCHELKITPQYFDGQLSGTKTFELRFNDREFAVGDTLHLREYADGTYTGREIYRQVSGILAGPCYGLIDGWVILSTLPSNVPLLTPDEINELAEPFGYFEYGDAQGHKRVGFAQAVENLVRKKAGMK